MAPVDWKHNHYVAPRLAIYLLIAVAAEAVLVRLNVTLVRSRDGRRGRWDATDIAGTIVLGDAVANQPSSPADMRQDD
jgi:hypothetical protein